MLNDNINSIYAMIDSLSEEEVFKPHMRKDVYKRQEVMHLPPAKWRQSSKTAGKLNKEEVIM